MSDIPVDYANRLNLANIVARIERAQAEPRKFVAEHDKLSAESAEFCRKRFLAPILAAGALGGFIAAAVPLIFRSWGVH